MRILFDERNESKDHCEPRVDSYDLLTLSESNVRKIRQENNDESSNRGKYFNFIFILYEKCDN